MEGKQQAMDVLSGWRAFVDATGLAKSRVKGLDISQEQQIRFSRDTVQEDIAGFSFSLSEQQSKDLKQRFLKQNEQGQDQAEPLQLGFPLLRVVEGKNTFFVPLFRYTLPDSWHTQPQLELCVPVKQGADVAPDIAAFREYLDVDIEELGAERHMMSIAAACMGEQRDDFIGLFKLFLPWVIQRLRDLGAKGVSLEHPMTALVCPQVNTDYNANEQLKDYKVLLERADLSASPLLQQYIENRSANIGTTPAAFSRFPYGLFEHKYPLGRGQMATLAQVSSGASLLAVQGAPGTGKTTLFKSLIASQIVERALACIAGNDHNLGLVVTSTAKKAVENVIDDLRKDSCLKDVKWLYFLGGDKAQVATQVERVNALLVQLDEQSYEKDKQLQLATQIAKTKQLIDHGFSRFSHLQHALNQAQAAFAGLPPEAFIERLEALTRDVLDTGLTLELLREQEQLTDINVLAQRCSAAQGTLSAEREVHARAQKRLARSFGHLIDAPFPEADYQAWVESELSGTLEHHFADYPTGMFAPLLGWLFKARYVRAHEHLKKTYAADFSAYKLADLDHTRLAELARNRRELFKASDIPEVLKTLTAGAPGTEREKALVQLARKIEELSAGINAWKRFKSARDILHTEFPEGDWIEVLRTRFIVQQRTLFESAIDYLWQALLRKKTALAEVLPLWCNLLNGQQDAGFYKWKDKLDEFYCLITLAYPVMASTLASVQKLAGYKLNHLNGFTPYQLSLVDEAGMISAESLVPLLARSRRAIVVGDPLQIEPIRTLGHAMARKLKDQYFADNGLYEAVSPMLVTAYHRAAGTLTGAINDTGNGMVLEEHRRCQPAIAQLFMEIAGYTGVQVCTGSPEPRIQKACDNMGGFNLMFYGVQGRKDRMPNTNQDEVEAIGLLLDKLESAGYNLTEDIGIITPYSNQKQLLIKAYGERLNHRQALKIGSVHQFQGVGFEVIIYSPVIFQRSDSDKFQNDKPNLLNVAVSRAKQQFIVVGNQQRLLTAGKSLAKLAKSCSASFFVSMEHQSPSFASVTSNGIKHYFDCDHIDAFETLLSQSQRSFTAVVPWIRQGTNQNHPPLNLLRAAKERGIAVTIYYGYYREGDTNADNSDPGLIIAYRRALGTERVIRLPEGTHEKILLVDDQVATVGSWNWLSHSYYQICKVPASRRLALRRETSVELRDPQLIEQLKARIGHGH
jgi:hypothetical protein